MLDAYTDLIAKQFEAAFRMLSEAIDQCSVELWQGPVVELTFDQAAFHTLFFADVYLGNDLPALREQPFHRQHEAVFGEYEELESRRQVQRYERPFVRDYLRHCRDKAACVLAAEDEANLLRESGLDWIAFSRAELHAYNLRHIQHHAAQLSLHLRQQTGDGIHWHSSGWGGT